MSQKGMVVNEASFKGLKDEYNKFIGIVLQYQTDITKFENEDFIQIENIKHVRRVFKLSYVHTRSKANRQKTLDNAIKERNDLLVAVNKILEQKHSSTSAAETRRKNVDDNVITTALSKDSLDNAVISIWQICIRQID